MTAALRTPARFLIRPTQSAQVAALGALLPVIYGRDRVAPLVPFMTVHAGKLYVPCLWCIGEIDAVESITINDAAPPAAVTIRHYLGTASQGVDSGLAAAVSGYADNLRGTHRGHAFAVAYSVLEIPSGAISGIPRVMAVIRGRKVLDDRTSTTAYSNNPALCLADFIRSPLYGQGRDVTGVADAADACDELVSGEKRREIGVTIRDEQPTESWVETLRNYAGAFVIPRGDSVHLVPDRPAASAATIPATSIVAGSLSVAWRDLADTPTVVRVRYTDTTEIPWREGQAVAYAAGVIEGDTPWREEDAGLTGIQRGTQAVREATERLNAAHLGGMLVSFTGFDECLKFEAGNVVTLSHARFSGAIRLARNPQMVARGRYKLEGYSYDAGIYSNVAAWTDLLAPPPAPRADDPDPPSIDDSESGNATALTTIDGTTYSRIKVSLVPSTDPNFSRFEVRFRRDGTSEPWQEALVEGAVAYIQPVIEGVAYDFQVRSISKSGAVSDWVDGAHTVTAKDVPPDSIDSVDVDADSTTGTRTISITYDPPADIAGWRIEYSHEGGAYVPLIDGLTLRKVVETTRIPAGNAVIRARAEDRTGNVSAWTSTSSTLLPPPVPEGIQDAIDTADAAAADAAAASAAASTAQGTANTALAGANAAFKPPSLNSAGPPNAAGQTFDGDVARFTWDRDAGAQRYRVQIWASGSQRRQRETADLHFEYSSEDARTDGGPWRTIEARVYSVDYSGNVSAGYRALSLTNNAPAAASISVAATSNYVMITLNSVPSDKDLMGLLISASTSSGFAPESNVKLDMRAGAIAPVIPLPVLPGSTWYVKAAWYDGWGKTGLNWSGQGSGTATLIQTVHIDNNAITSAKIAAAAVTSTQIADGSVSTPKLVAGAVQAGNIAAGAITADKIAANAIEAGKIAANAVTAQTIAANAVSADKMNVATLSAITANVGTLTAGTLRDALSRCFVRLSAGVNDAFLECNNSSGVRQFHVTPGGAIYARGDIEAQSLKANTVMVNTIHVAEHNITMITSAYGGGPGTSWPPNGSWSSWSLHGYLDHQTIGYQKTLIWRIYTDVPAGCRFQMGLSINDNSAPSYVSAIDSAIDFEVILGGYGWSRYYIWWRAFGNGNPIYVGDIDIACLEGMR